jgi:hypothetical protein
MSSPCPAMERKEGGQLTLAGKTVQLKGFVSFGFKISISMGK